MQRRNVRNVILIVVGNIKANSSSNPTEGNFFTYFSDTLERYASNYSTSGIFSQ